MSTAASLEYPAGVNLLSFPLTLYHAAKQCHEHRFDFVWCETADVSEISGAKRIASAANTFVETVTMTARARRTALSYLDGPG